MHDYADRQIGGYGSGMTDGVVLRDVHDDDSAALIELIATCWADYPGCVMDVDGEEPWLRAPARSYAEWQGRFWVVEIDGSVVACGGLRPKSDSTIELKSLYVAKPARRRGIAHGLVEVIEDEARSRGARGIELWSDTRFADGHAFYRKHGYVHTGRTRELHDLSNSVEYEFFKELGD